VQVGVTRGGLLVGFAFARVLRGEFGREQASATLDAVGVEHDSRDRGVGRALMAGITKLLREKGVQSLQSQADWTSHGLLRFFESSGFRLAPRLVLERSMLAPLAEQLDED
jgi:GNAT superfamily N-acetyltransferase